MALNRSDCVVFDLLQTPLWIIEQGQTWYSNKAALSLVAQENVTFPEINDPLPVSKFLQPIGHQTYQCTATKITIEQDRPALLIEVHLDERHDLLLEASPDGVMIADGDTGAILQVNQKALALTKKQPRELIGIHHSQLYEPNQQEAAAQAFQQYVGGWCTGWTIPRNDRPNLPVDIYATLFVDGSKKYIYGFFRDQTEQKRIEAEWHNTLSELEQRESQLRLALSSANVICWEYSFKLDLVQGIGTFLPTGWEMLSWQMTLDEAFSKIYPPDVSPLKRKIYDQFANGGSFFHEIRLADFDASPRWFLVSGEVKLDRDGRPDRIVGVTLEITQKKQIELELQANRIKTEAILNNIPSLICLKDTNQKFTYGNFHLLNTFSLTREQFFGKTNQDIFAPDLAFTLDYIDRQVISTHKSVQTELELSQGGQTRIYLSAKFPLFDEANNIQGIGGITTDITELKQAESKIIQNQAFLNCLINIQQQLLVDDDRNCYQTILRQLGEAAKASRVYIFANHRSVEGLLLSDQIYEWCAPGIEPTIDSPELQNLNMEIFFPRWIKQFLKGQEISGNVLDFPETEQHILSPQGILSILVLPLFVNHQFWGFMGFDNCPSHTPFSEAALALLRSAASAISFHIERQENQRILIEERQKATEANAAKSRFLANMSHELRTPMNGVIGLTSLLQTTAMTEEQQDYIRTIRNSSETLLSLINDILDFSKIESGRVDLEIQEFNLRNCIEEVIDLLAPQATAKGLELTYWLEQDVPEFIRSDVTRLRQILLNLLSNAIKFTEKGNIFIEVSLIERSNNGEIKLSFTVTDEGIGIPQDRLDQIFTPFTQADSSITRRYGGTGLGLSICYRLTQLLGGEMSVQTILGKGSSFQFYIITKEAEPSIDLLPLPAKKIYLSINEYPLKQMISSMLLTWRMEILDEPIGADLIITETLQESTTPQILLLAYGKTDNHPLILNKPVRYNALYKLLARLYIDAFITQNDQTDREELIHLPLRILVAEDNIVNQKVCLKMLHKLGYEADLVANGLEVLEAFERQTYDVILMDIQMPEMDGLTATKAIRSRSGFQPWIIALTADAQLETAQQSYASGVNDYLTKPIRIEDLAPALRRAYYQKNLIS
jgi:PAS domain S-box-containing protein